MPRSPSQELWDGMVRPALAAGASSLAPPSPPDARRPPRPPPLVELAQFPRPRRRGRSTAWGRPSSSGRRRRGPLPSPRMRSAPGQNVRRGRGDTDCIEMTTTTTETFSLTRSALTKFTALLTGIMWWAPCSSRSTRRFTGEPESEGGVNRAHSRQHQRSALAGRSREAASTG